MVSIVIRPFQDQERHEVIELWRKCGLIVPVNDPQKDIDCKMQMASELFLVGLRYNKVVAAIMGSYDGHRGWLNYLAVDSRWRGKGYGRSMVEAVESRLQEKGCPKVNLQVRSGNTKVLDFYRRLGYQCDDVVSLGKRLETDQRITNNLTLPSICNCSAVLQMRTSRLDNYSNAMFSSLIVRRGKRRLRGVLLNSY